MYERCVSGRRTETVTYRKCGIEEYDYPENTWDMVVSNLALHYIEDLENVFERVAQTLKPGGVFMFNSMLKMQIMRQKKVLSQ